MELKIIKNIVFLIYWIRVLSVLWNYVADKENRKNPWVNKSLVVMQKICMEEFYIKYIGKLLKYISMSFAITEISVLLLETVLFMLKSENKIIKMISLFLKTKLVSVIVICLVALVFMILILLTCSVLYSCIMYPIFTYLKNINKNHQKYIFGKIMQRFLGLMGIVAGFAILIISVGIVGNIGDGNTVINIKWFFSETKNFFLEYSIKVPAIVYAIGIVVIFAVNEIAYYQPGWKMAALEFALVVLLYSLTYKSIAHNIVLEIWWYKLYAFIILFSAICSSYRYRGKYTEICNAIIIWVIMFLLIEDNKMEFFRGFINRVQLNSIDLNYIMVLSFVVASLIIIFYSKLMKKGLEYNVSIFKEIELNEEYINRECNIFNCAIKKGEKTEKLQYLFYYTTNNMYIGRLQDGRWVRYDSSLNLWIDTREAPQFKHKYKLS